MRTGCLLTGCVIANGNLHDDGGSVLFMKLYTERIVEKKFNKISSSHSD